MEATGRRAMIGQLDDAADLVRGTWGTVVEPGRGDRDAGVLTDLRPCTVSEATGYVEW